jgi:RNA polymerase sigma factor (sigma-70 family)
MKAGDTSLGGPQDVFPETVWDVVARARNPSAEVRRTGFEELYRRYWKPIYHFVRVAWAKSNEDAKDLAQAFFLWLMEGDALDRYVPERAGFRTYLKALLRNFYLTKEQALQRLKRGGGIHLLNLDGEGSAFEAALPVPTEADPEKAFERAWRDHLLAEALGRVRERSLANHQPVKFRVFEEYYLSPDPDRRTYSTVARQLGIKESEVLHCLAGLREEVRTEIRRELSRTAANPEELEEEWNAFFGE